MDTYMKKGIIGILFLFASITLYAQELYIGLELRPRAEYRSGYGSPITCKEDPGGFMLQRTRLMLGYKNSVLKTGVTIQDSRTFGEAGTNSEPVNTSGTLSIQEAWAKLLLIPGASVTIGRQALKYDDKRIFSDANWSNTGTSHDLVLFSYELESLLTANLGLAYNNDKAISKESIYSGSTKYRYLGYLWISKPIGANWLISALAMDEGIQHTKTDPVTGNLTYDKTVDMYHRYITGGNIKFLNKNLPFDLFATAYFQFGKATASKDIHSYLLALKMNYTCSPKLIITIGSDLYSGDDGKDEQMIKTFQWLYGAPHSFNGTMDYWIAPMPKQGLIDVYGQVAGLVNRKLGYELCYHVFNTSKEIIRNDAAHGTSLGSEIDFRLTYKMNSWVSLEGGWSSYFLNDNSRYLKTNSANTDTHAPGWAYLMLTIKTDQFKLKS